MKYEIIQYNESYKEQLINFILSIQQNEFNIAIDRADQPDLEDIESNYLSSGGQFWMALSEDNEIVGCVGLVRLANNNSALKKMFVNSNMKNLKIGKKLLNKVVDTALNHNIEHIYLGTIDKFISAQHFYSNNGFKEIEQSALPPDFPKMDVDNRFYYRTI
ncbi:GNAT family N-acetyltransferase [Macrococcus equipercicus]|uniref:GNAT family N-acetyltransferase n=1 Tax=Macrococcus equipercicus TaxID=69967 RepID=A0ABQ6R9H5_9STAP|nr:GNAT family N-acetyltransferase [Macrococcus equipercicus]KAA1039951.1 GNAT family N-acetyltransferase [Macrococcus equipercicus]